MASSTNYYFRFALLATILALVVVMLGAYTRLADAGLGCPDWPGCYGQLVAPHTAAEIQQAEKAFPGQVVEPAKAWAEMIHRYFAGTLGLFIIILLIWAIARRVKQADQPIVLPVLLVLLVVFQAVLGMWTVTWKVLPLVVMAHLLGGMTIAALLWGLTLSACQCPRRNEVTPLRGFRFWAILGLIILSLQIFLGAWTSTNYASIVCPDFPFCQGSLFPPLDFQQGFNFFSPIGADYQGGTLSTIARVTIQMTHRYGAIITATYIGILAICLMFSRREGRLRSLGWIILGLLVLQFLLGIANVEWLLPMPIAVAHNGVAALLLLAMVTLIYKVFVKTKEIF